MNIILVSEKLAKARTITLGLPQFALLATGVLLSLVTLAAAMNYLMLRFAADINVPYLQTMLLSAQHEQNEKSQHYLRDRKSVV